MSQRPEQLVNAYFSCMRNRDSGVADLFAEDASLIGLGRVVSGREAIRKFYSDAIRDAAPTPELVDEMLVSGGRVAAEIRIALANGSSVHVVDLFVVDAGAIQSLTYFVADD